MKTLKIKLKHRSDMKNLKRQSDNPKETPKQSDK